MTMIGTIAAGYRIEEKIGEGGVGEVYRGLDLMLNRSVAVKVLRPELARDTHVRERFRTEANVLASLSHPNIAGIHALQRHGDMLLMVMELVQGRNLEQHLADAPPTVQGALEIVLQAARALAYAHARNVVHRDIKPANLMLDDAGVVKVTDFGIARMLGDVRLTRQGAVVGTPSYMAPEQIRGENADARSDIYALAIVLYELLAGQPPFGGCSEYEILRSQVECRPPPLRRLRPDIPRNVEAFLECALQKKPERRYQSADEVINVLSRALSLAEPDRAASRASDSSPPCRILRYRFRRCIRLYAFGLGSALAVFVGAAGVVDLYASGQRLSGRNEIVLPMSASPMRPEAIEAAVAGYVRPSQHAAVTEGLQVPPQEQGGERSPIVEAPSAPPTATTPDVLVRSQPAAPEAPQQQTEPPPKQPDRTGSLDLTQTGSSQAVPVMPPAPQLLQVETPPLGSARPITIKRPGVARSGQFAGWACGTGWSIKWHPSGSRQFCGH